MNDRKSNKSRPSLSTLILIGLASGVAVGLFFGEMVSGLKLVGRAYIVTFLLATLLLTFWILPVLVFDGVNFKNPEVRLPSVILEKWIVVRA